MSVVYSRRLKKELQEIQIEQADPTKRAAGIQLLQADDLKTWFFSIEVLGESLYKNEVFHLMVRFDPEYPFKSPAVQFVVSDKVKPPVHPHVYTNGHICASILGDDWSPTLSVMAICITIQSMLASCKKKELPEGNDDYVRTAPDNPKKTRFVYHDDTV
ncbi:UBC-like protein [Lactarius pseudohatsudake]|nr:UBC-like protein [Lactarius pseudohatsudake]KAH9075742.1 UBC-like protein [Lactarius deliciosus]